MTTLRPWLVTLLLALIILPGCKQRRASAVGSVRSSTILAAEACDSPEEAAVAAVNSAADAATAINTTLPFAVDPAGITPRPSVESSFFDFPTTLSTADAGFAACYREFGAEAAPASARFRDTKLRLVAPVNPAVARKAPKFDERSYSARPLRKSFSVPTADQIKVLASNSTLRQRRDAIAGIETSDILSAAAHLELRNPGKVIKFAEIIRIDAESTRQEKEEIPPEKRTYKQDIVNQARAILKKFAEEPIQINVFIEESPQNSGTFRIAHVECVDGNHRLAAGLVSGKWGSVADIPPEFVEVRVNGERTSDRQKGLAQRDIHWLPATIADEAAFKASFKEISIEEWNRRTAIGYDANKLGKNEFFRVPREWLNVAEEEKKPTIALHPAVASNNAAMGSKAGVPMWQVVRRTMVRDGIVSLEDFND